jgi:hypothetical protein
VQIDYKDEETIKKAAAELGSKGVSLDVLVNCGGGLFNISWDLSQE